MIRERDGPEEGMMERLDQGREDDLTRRFISYLRMRRVNKNVFCLTGFLCFLKHKKTAPPEMGWVIITVYRTVVCFGDLTKVT